MSNYRSYLLRQMGIKESSFKPAGIQPSDVDPKELEMGVKDEKEHTNDPELAKKIALHHLKQHGDYYSRIKKAGLEEGPDFQHALSPTAVATPVIAIAVRGSSTGGLPSGADRNMSAAHVDGIDVSKLSKGQLGGYEPVVKDKPNSELIDKTPNNPQINSSAPIVDTPQTQIDPHPHQVQKAEGEPPQDVTGASTDGDDTLKLRMAMPKGVDVDVSENDQSDTEGKCMTCGGELDTDDEGHPECSKCRSKNHPQHASDFLDETFARHKYLLQKKLNEGKHKAGCECGFCKNKGKITEKVKKTSGDVADKEIGKMQKDKSHRPFPFDKDHPELAAKPDKPNLKTKHDECKDCGCGKPNTEHDKKPLNEAFARIGVLAGIAPIKEEEQPKKDEPKKVQVRKVQYVDPKTKTSKEVDWVSTHESYSPPFERMRGLANLGERRVMANGLWGEGKAGVGANEPFQTKWKMDPEKAGMVKIDEAKLNAIMETLSKKTTLTEKEEKLSGLAKKLADLKKRKDDEKANSDHKKNMDKLDKEIRRDDLA